MRSFSLRLTLSTEFPELQGKAVVHETNLGSNLSAAGVALLMQSVSMFGIGRLGSVLSSESWFRAVECLSATGGSQLGSKLSVAVELMVGSRLSTYDSLIANEILAYLMIEVESSGDNLQG